MVLADKRLAELGNHVNVHLRLVYVEATSVLLPNLFVAIGIAAHVTFV
jgi:hypothetical protein